MKRLTLLFLFIPSLLFSQQDTTATVTIAWDANTESDLAGYKVYYGTKSRDYSNMIDVGNVIEHSIPDFARGFEYFFAVTAYDFSGNESNFSNEVSITIPDDTPPDPPVIKNIEEVQ